MRSDAASRETDRSRSNIEKQALLLMMRDERCQNHEEDIARPTGPEVS